MEAKVTNIDCYLKITRNFMEFRVKDIVRDEYLFNFFFFEMASTSIAQAGLELVILLPQLLKYWNYRHMVLHLVIKWFYSYPSLHNFCSLKIVVTQTHILL